jgi:integrase
MGPLQHARPCASTAARPEASSVAQIALGGRSRPFGPSSVRQRADDAWKDAELDRITLHEARHTFASLMIAAGVNAKALSTYMGHSSIQVTYDKYGHLMPGNEEEAASLLDAYLERTNTRGRLAQLA